MIFLSHLALNLKSRTGEELTVELFFSQGFRYRSRRNGCSLRRTFQLFFLCFFETLSDWLIWLFFFFFHSCFFLLNRLRTYLNFQETNPRTKSLSSNPENWRSNLNTILKARKFLFMLNSNQKYVDPGSSLIPLFFSLLCISLLFFIPQAVRILRSRRREKEGRHFVHWKGWSERKKKKSKSWEWNLTKNSLLFYLLTDL